MHIFRTYKIIALVVTGLFLFFALNLFNEIKNIITLFRLTKYAEESSINPNLVYLFFGLTLFFGIVLFVVYLKVSSQKENNVLNASNNLVKDADNSDEEEMQKEFFDKQQKEKARKNAIIDQIVRELEGRGDLKDFSDKFLSNIAKQFDIVQGLLFIKNPKNEKFKMIGNYAWYSDEPPREFEEGEGLSGQVAKNRKLVDVNNVPENYITVLSGLGNSSPNHLVIFPILFDNEPIGVVELASFKPFNDESKLIFDGLSRIVGQQVFERVSKL